MSMLKVEIEHPSDAGDTLEEAFENIYKVMMEDTYTGEVKELNTEGDEDFDEDRGHQMYFIENVITGKKKYFLSVWDAFDYKYQLKIKYMERF